MACLGAFVVSWIMGYAICRAVLRARWPDVPLCSACGLGWAVGAAFSGMTTFWAIVLAPAIAGHWWPVPARSCLASASLDLAGEPAIQRSPRSGTAIGACGQVARRRGLRGGAGPLAGPRA